MTNNSSNFFRKVLKTGLITASSAAIMLSSSGVLAAAVARGVISNFDGANFDDADVTNHWIGIEADGTPVAGGVNGPADGFSITYGGDHAINANVIGIDIQAINVGATTPGVFTVIESVGIGSVVTDGNTIPVTIANNKSLNLTGTAANNAADGFNAAANTYTGLGALTFPAAGGVGTLFVGTTNINPITLTNAINNGAQATLKVATPVTFTDPTAATIKVINIGVGRTSSLTLDAVNGNFSLLPTAASIISFEDEDSKLILQNTAITSKTITLAATLNGVAGNGGNVDLIGPDVAAAGEPTLTLQSATGAQTLGGGGAKLNTLGVGGAVVISGDVANNKQLDVSNALVLNIYADAKLIDNNRSSVSIPAINIGAAPDGGAVGAAIYAIDAVAGDFGILGAGKAINFMDEESGLVLTNSATDDRVVTLKNDMSGFIGGGGILGLFGKTNLLTLQGDGGTKTLGIAGAPLASLDIAGQVVITNIDASTVPELNVGNGAIFIDNTTTTAQIAQINIGTSVEELGLNEGPAMHVIDVSTAAAAVNLLGDNVIFWDAGSTFKIQNTVAGNKIVTLADNIEGGVVVDPADPAIPNGGIVELNAGDAGSILTIDGGGGAGNSLGTAANKLQTLTFSGLGEIKLINNTSFNAVNLDLGISAITLGDITQHLEFSGNTILTETGNIASVDFKGKNAIINMANGTKIIGAVTNTVNPATNNGIIEFKNTGQIGGAINGLAMLKVGAGAVTLTAGGATTITEIQGTGTDTVTLGPDFNLTGGINLTGGQPLKLNFTNGGSISGLLGTPANPVGGLITKGVTSFANAVNSSGPVTTSGITTFTKAYTNNGTATFSGTTSFADTFNNTGAVTLANNSINHFTKDVTATSFKADGAIMSFDDNLTFSSAITGSGTTIALDIGQVTYVGQASFSDKLTIATSFSTAGDALSIGNILIKAGSKIDLSKVTDLAIQADISNVDINKVNVSTNNEVKLISAVENGGLVPTSNNNIHLFVNGQENRFLAINLDTSSLTISVANIAKEILEEEIEEENFSPAVKESIKILLRAPEGTDSASYINNLGFFEEDSDIEASLGHLIENTVRPGDGATAMNTQVVSSNITSNLSSLSTRMDRVQATNTAVAAGDEDGASFGIWGSPFFGDAKQKMRKNINGYKSNSNGATVGFDSLVDDDLLLGVAYTRADTKIKQKNNKVGDKSKVESNIYSLYGLYNLPNQNWFFEAIASYGDSKIRNYSQRVIALGLNTAGTQTAIGKYKSRSYTGQILAGYNYLAPQDINLTPTIGIRYTGTKDSGYTETGTTFQNLTVKGKKYNSVDGLIGAKVSQDIKVESLVLTPSAYGMLDYSFKNKTPAIDARLQGMDSPFPTNSFKAAKTSFNFGVGLATKYQMMEYGVNYDANVASKYFAQQGSLKVRVNF